MALRVTDWEYYRKIDEDNPFIDGYQVKLTIWAGNCGKDNTSTGNLDLDSYTNSGSDFRDIAFGDGSDPSSCNELDYWIENTGTDSGDDYAIVWVELNSTVASNNSFYVFYESDTATDYSNGANTFLEFEDFSGDLSGWTFKSGSEETSIVSGELKHGLAGGELFMQWGSTQYSDIAIDAKTKWTSNTSEAGRPVILIRYDGSDYGAETTYFGYARISLSHLRIYETTNGSHASLASQNATYTANHWHLFTFKAVGTTLKCEIVDLEGSLDTYVTTTDSTLTTGYIGIRSFEGDSASNYLYFDDIRARKYAATEPSYDTFNSETELGGAETYTKSTSTSITLQTTTTLDTPSSITLFTITTLDTPSSITLQTTESLDTHSSITLETSNSKETNTSITLKTSSTLDTYSSVTLQVTGALETTSSITTQETGALTTISSISTEAPGLLQTPSSITLETIGNTLTTISSITLYQTQTLITPTSITLSQLYTQNTTTSITLETSPILETPTSITLQTQDNGTSTPTSITIYETYTQTTPSSITLETSPTLDASTSITLKTLSNQLDTLTSITLGEANTLETQSSITLEATKNIGTITSVSLATTQTIDTATSITLQKTKTLETSSSIATTNTYTQETTSSITLTTTGWRCATSDNYRSHCGDDGSHTIEEALDGTDSWNHDIQHTHWFILDLEKKYTISKVKSWSDYYSTFNYYDPDDVDIYISDDTDDWGTAVHEGISTWTETTSYVEITLDTEKTGRYIKVVVNSTAHYSNYLRWGDNEEENLKPIFCFYGTPITTQTLTTQSSIHLQRKQTLDTTTSITLIQENIPLETPSSITLEITLTLETQSSIHIVSGIQIETHSSITLITSPTQETNSSITLTGTNTVATTSSISLYLTYTTHTNTSITLQPTYIATTPTSITTKTHNNTTPTTTSITIVERYTLTTPTSITLQTTPAPATTTSITLTIQYTTTTTTSITLYDNAEIIINRKSPVLDYTTDDCTYIPTHTSLNPTHTISLEIEINPDINTNTEKYLLYKNNRYKLTLGDGTYSYPSFGVYIDGAWRTVSMGENITVDTWSHLMGTYDKDTHTLSIYCDGTLKNSDTLSGLGSYEIGST